MVRHCLAKLALTGLFFVGLLEGLPAREWRAGALSASISLASLPQQGRETYQRIHQGGPFLFVKDGVVFGNRERLLPLQTRGYYREYTVIAKGSADRGPQRIVCGGPATTPEACYYTADHYASFRRIVP